MLQRTCQRNIWLVLLVTFSQRNFVGIFSNKNSVGTFGNRIANEIMLVHLVKEVLTDMLPTLCQPFYYQIPSTLPIEF